MVEEFSSAFLMRIPAGSGGRRSGFAAGFSAFPRPFIITTLEYFIMRPRQHSDIVYRSPT